MTRLLNHHVGQPPPSTGSSAAPVWAIGAPRLLAGLDSHRHLDLLTHLHVHGDMPEVDMERLLNCLDAIGPLAGRGGAGFPFADKLRSLAPGPRRVIVNGSESEPASLKDRVLLRRTPHLVLDGAVAVAAACRARELVVAVRDEGTARVVRDAAAERADGHWIRVLATNSGFVGGEARSVVRAVDGGPALPPGRRTPPTFTGTLVSNAETFAQLAVLVRMGPYDFAASGTRDEPGTTLLTVGGAVQRPGVVEVPLGTPLGVLLGAAQTPERPQAVVVGGYHGSWHEPNLQIRISRAGMASAGGTLGAGVVLALSQQTCALGELARVARWLADQSAGQCGPCVFGLPALAEDVEALVDGQSRVGRSFARARAVTGRGSCSHPDGAARFVVSGLHYLHDETDLHLSHGGCNRPIRGELPLAAERRRT